MVDKGAGKVQDGSYQFCVSGCRVIPLKKTWGHEKENRSDRGNLFSYIWSTRNRYSAGDYIVFYFLFYYFYFTILYSFCHTSTCILHGYTRVPHPEPPFHLPPIPSLWVIPVHQPQASYILHQTWTGDSFLIWYYTCFNAILPNHHPPPCPRVQKTVLYICVSFAVSHTGLSLPSF